MTTFSTPELIVGAFFSLCLGWCLGIAWMRRRADQFLEALDRKREEARQAAIFTEREEFERRRLASLDDRKRDYEQWTAERERERDHQRREMERLRQSHERDMDMLRAEHARLSGAIQDARPPRPSIGSIAKDIKDVIEEVAEGFDAKAWRSRLDANFARTIVGQGECYYCHAPFIEEEAAACRACSSVAHRECLVANQGRCGRYGCANATRGPSPA